MYKAATSPALTCREAPPRNRPWLGWSPGGRRCDSRSCSTPAPSRPVAHLYAASPLCIWLSPSGSQCDWNSESRSQAIEIFFFFTSVTFVLMALLQKSNECIKTHIDPHWPAVQKQDRPYRPLQSETYTVKGSRGLIPITLLANVNSWQDINLDPNRFLPMKRSTHYIIQTSLSLHIFNITYVAKVWLIGMWVFNDNLIWKF